MILQVAEPLATKELFVGAEITVGIFGDEDFLESCKAKDNS